MAQSAKSIAQRVIRAEKAWQKKGGEWDGQIQISGFKNMAIINPDRG
jgi:hypothetical protein